MLGGSLQLLRRRLLSSAEKCKDHIFRSNFDCAAKRANAEVNFNWGLAKPVNAEDIPSVTGSVHSVESFSAVDGPGVRFLVFLQGCGYRCLFCSNPDTWAMHKGRLMTTKELAVKIDKVKPYLRGHEGSAVGGVTVSGGEAMLQPQFVAALFLEAHARGLTTCIDTTGQGTKAHHWDIVLPHTDYALFCIKSPDPEKYMTLTKRPMGNVLKFWNEMEAHEVKYWMRYVLIPGMTDAQSDIDKLVKLCSGRKNLQAVEVLPYHLLGVQKWEEMGLEYPLAGQRTPTNAETMDFVRQLTERGIPVLCNKFS